VVVEELRPLGVGDLDGAEGGHLGGELITERVHNPERFPGGGELGVGLPRVLDLHLLARLRERNFPGVVAEIVISPSGKHRFSAQMKGTSMYVSKAPAMRLAAG